MFDKMPTDFSATVRTPDPVVVKIEPSTAMIAIFVGLTVVAAAWVKRKTG